MPSLLYGLTIILLTLAGTNTFPHNTVSEMKSHSFRQKVPTVSGTEYRVTTPLQVIAAMQQAVPGDVVVMADGIWIDARIVFEGNGTEKLPITLRAETPGKVFLTGKSNLRIAGSYLVVDGLIFMDGYSPAGAVVEFRNGAGNEASHCRLTNTAIIDFNPPDRLLDYKWVSLHGAHNRLDHCYIKGKDHAGTTVVVWLSDQPNYHLIDNNYFGHRPALGQNGGETIRVGTSHWSLHDSHTIVEYNYFERCNGEVEIISNKSCENIYRYNTFFECEGALTLRHGNRCLVDGNFFFGNQKTNTGGVRIIGEDHIVINNYFEGLRGVSARSALSMVNGVPDSPLYRYFQVKRAVVAFNTFYNNRRNFDIGIFKSDEISLPPEDCIIANNAVYSVNTDRPLIIETDNPINMKYEGNIFYGAHTGVNASGILRQNPQFQLSEDGLWRPAETSPVIGAAVGDYPYVTDDMDGQPRDSEGKDVGADQRSETPVLRRPLTAEDAGPLWFTGEENLVPGIQVFPPVPIEPFKSYAPKANQLGYLPGSKKWFTIASDSVVAGQSFVVTDEKGEGVFWGTLEENLFDDREISGEEVFRGEFSGLTTPGNYLIESGDFSSRPFDIAPQVYDSALYHMLRFFYLVRANEPLNDPVTGLQHGESHTGDGSLDDGSGNILDLTGGWYAGGDFGKRVPQTAVACSRLMHLYKSNPLWFDRLDLIIPESGGAAPDILVLVKTGLDWLLKMQREDGAVFHKVDSDAESTYGYGPDEDPSQRMLGFPGKFSTIDAAVLAAVMAQASGVYSPVDSAFAATCKEAALKSWNWVKANPGIGQEDPYSFDTQSWQEEMWAKAEVYMITGDQTILSSFYNDLRNRSASGPDLTSPQLMGCIGLFHHPGLPSIVKGWIELVIMDYAKELKRVVDLSGYGSAVDKYNWSFGSNALTAGYGAVFIYAYRISGDAGWLNYAWQQLDYLLGRNSLDYSFVTGLGTRRVGDPHHWINHRYRIVPPGLMVQGAVEPRLITSTHDKVAGELKEAGFPVAKTYADSSGSPSLNGVDLHTVSALAFLTGYLSVHDRDVNTTAPLLTKAGKNSSPELVYREGYLYCENCRGKTRISLYGINGQLLYEKSVTAEKGTPLVEAGGIVKDNSIILYRVIDETGRTGSGKIGFQ